MAEYDFGEVMRISEQKPKRNKLGIVIAVIMFVILAVSIAALMVDTDPTLLEEKPESRIQTLIKGNATGSIVPLPETADAG